MKFLLFALVTRFVTKLVIKKRNPVKKQEAEGKKENIYHPAEFELRWG